MTELSDKLKNTLDEGRILVIGAQVLLGFHFRCVFEPAFEKLPLFTKYLEVAGLGLMLVALAFLIWPGTYHQIVARGEDRQDVQHFATAVLGWAILPFAFALGIDFFTTAEFLFGRTEGVIAGIVAWATAILLWYGLELFARWRLKDRTAEVVEMSNHLTRGRTKLNDKIEQVLTEIRVVLPGAQTLIGFQFIAIFMDAFQKLPPTQRLLHFASLSFVGLAVVLLMTPAAYHRLVERGENTEHFHQFASKVLLLSLIPLALGISGDFYIVARKVTGSMAVSFTLAICALLIFYGLWFGFTITKRRAQEQNHDENLGVRLSSFSG